MTKTYRVKIFSKCRNSEGGRKERRQAGMQGRDGGKERERGREEGRQRAGQMG